MRSHTFPSEQRERRYPLLTFFDLSLNFMLCCGVVALGCVLLGIVLSHNAPRILAQVSFVAARILS
jgi:hypothetical protein